MHFRPDVDVHFRREADARNIVLTWWRAGRAGVHRHDQGVAGDRTVAGGFVSGLLSDMRLGWVGVLAQKRERVRGQRVRGRFERGRVGERVLCSDRCDGWVSSRTEP